MNMAASHEPSWLHRVWRDWRPEILRGAFLFAIVAFVGVAVMRQVRAFEPLALLRDHGVSLGDGDRNWVDAYSWSGVVDGGPVWIRNLNGAITIERADGTKCERCWKYTTDVGTDAAFPTVCANCAAAIRDILGS